MEAAVFVIPLVGLVFPIALLLGAVAVDIGVAAWYLVRTWHGPGSQGLWLFLMTQIVDPLRHVHVPHRHLGQRAR